MEVAWPESAAALLEDWPRWFVENGVLWTRLPAGQKTRGVWIECENCGRIAPAHHYNAKRFCSLACRNQGLVGEKAANWVGGRSLQKNGYIRISVPNPDDPRHRRRLLEHRYVMEQEIGRPLKRYESVHHKNGNRQDNRIENLELWVGSHPPGASEKHCPTCTCFAH